LKRVSPLLVAIAALAIAAPAGAAERIQHKGVPEPSVSLQVVLINGEVAKVNKFKFFNIAVGCDEGILFITRNKALPAMGVNKRGRFGKTFDFAGAEEVRVKGKVAGDGSSSKGSIRIRGNFTEGDVRYNNCDSGKVKWKAG
jgi:hypothetical protein